MTHPLPTYLPGSLDLAPGTFQDYLALAPFHYLQWRPATVAGVWTVRYASSNTPARPVAVGVLSYPTLACHAREKELGIADWPRREKAAFANQHIRTISRVIVHPQFRALGLATRLIRCMCQHCPTRYIEALAHMGRAHPMFKSAGMKEIVPDNEESPVYYMLDLKEFNNPKIT